MKNVIFFMVTMILSGCFGYSSIDNEATGQVKRVHHETPIICPEYTDVDISLGVLRNGIGSMSTQDIFLNVTSSEQEKILSEAALSGALVKIKYKEARIRFCLHDSDLTSVEILK